MRACVRGVSLTYLCQRDALVQERLHRVPSSVTRAFVSTHAQFSSRRMDTQSLSSYLGTELSGCSLDCWTFFPFSISC